MARVQRTGTGNETLKGELVAFAVKSQDHWGIGRVRTLHDGGDVTIAGKILGARVGDTVELTGVTDQNARWGKQFRVYTCEVLIPQDASGVVGWLASTLPQISRRRAEALVEAHGVSGTWSILDERNVEALVAIDGITADRAAEILDAYHANKGERDRVVRLKSWGLTDGQCAKVVAEWGDDCEAELERNPYRLIECVPGFGWERADKVAQRMGVSLDSPSRLAAGALHAMGEAVQAGHCYVSRGKLVRIVADKVCKVSDERMVRHAVDVLVGRGALVEHGPNLYLPDVADAETFLAASFAERAAHAHE